FDRPRADLAPVQPPRTYVRGLNDSARSELLRAADLHHVIVRALRVLKAAAAEAGDADITAWCEAHLAKEQARIALAISFLEKICNALESAGCPTVVIKSLDHWPDLGSDLDLYTSADEHSAIRAMRTHFSAEQEP